METKTAKGFTIIELLVALAIMTFLMAVVSFNYGSSNDKLSIAAAGQELAVALRQTQVYGLAVRESGIGSTVFDYGYGIYLSIDPAQNDKYIIFVDKNFNNAYDAGSGCGSGYANTECVESVPLRNNIKITAIELCDDAAGTCGPGSPFHTPDALQITFKRPSTDSSIVFYQNGGAVTGTAVNGNITLTSPKGRIYTVTIYRTGQINTNLFGPSESK